MKVIASSDLEKYSNDFINLERVVREKECHEQLLAFLINLNMTNSDEYYTLWTEYLNITQIWKQTLNAISKSIIPEYLTAGKHLQNWEYLFEEQELRIYEI